MPNSYFQFKQFTIQQDRSAMKVTTDACLFGAWVAAIIKELQPGVGNVLDIGTGTGLLSCMIAQENTDINIDAVEIDDEAFAQAVENVAASPFAGRIKVLHGDIKTFSFEKKYDCIISNPPFYENELKPADIKKNVAHHASGLLLEDLLSIIKENLSDAGVFFVLLPFKRNEEIRQLLFKQKISIEKICFVKQTDKHDYFRFMLMGRMNDINAETMIEEIIIMNHETQRYTPEFVQLLGKYYLKLNP